MKNDKIKKKYSELFSERSAQEHATSMRDNRSR